MRYVPSLGGALPVRIWSARGDRVQLFTFFATSRWRDDMMLKSDIAGLLDVALRLMCELEPHEISDVNTVSSRDLLTSDCCLLSRGFTAAPLCTVRYFKLLEKYVSRPDLYVLHLKQHPEAQPQRIQVGACRNLPLG